MEDTTGVTVLLQYYRWRSIISLPTKHRSVIAYGAAKKILVNLSRMQTRSYNDRNIITIVLFKNNVWLIDEQ